MKPDLKLIGVKIKRDYFSNLNVKNVSNIRAFKTLEQQ